jgi:hypothetical protein
MQCRCALRTTKNQPFTAPGCPTKLWCGGGFPSTTPDPLPATSCPDLPPPPPCPVISCSSGGDCCCCCCCCQLLPRPLLLQPSKPHTLIKPSMPPVTSTHPSGDSVTASHPCRCGWVIRWLSCPVAVSNFSRSPLVVIPKRLQPFGENSSLEKPAALVSMQMRASKASAPNTSRQLPPSASPSAAAWPPAGASLLPPCSVGLRRGGAETTSPQPSGLTAIAAGGWGRSGAAVMGPEAAKMRISW